MPVVGVSLVRSGLTLEQYIDLTMVMVHSTAIVIVMSGSGHEPGLNGCLLTMLDCSLSGCYQVFFPLSDTQIRW